MKVLIIGAGLAGLTTAYTLETIGEVDYIIVEKEPNIGGLCSTFITKEGFIFDKTLHVLHLRNPSVESLLIKLTKENGISLIKHTRKAFIYINKELIPYPFQAYFHLLSNKQIIKECLDGIKETIKRKKRRNVKPENFKQYIKYYFGSGIAKYFMYPYNEKLWTVPLSVLTYEWAERFVPKPNFTEILPFLENKYRSTKFLRKNWGYNPHFYYPEEGGIIKIPEVFLNNLKKNRIILNNAVKLINLKKKQALLEDGSLIRYDIIVSTMPLPNLLKILKGSLPLLRETADKLKYVSIFNLNFGISKKIDPNIHWIYFPQKDLIFHRITFPSTLSPKMAPKDCSSLSIEVSYSKFKPLCNKRKIKQRIIKDLISLNLIKGEKEIISEVEFDLRFAYVIYDKNYTHNRRVIHSFLRKHNIYSIGRFGSWKYSTMEDVILEGQRTAYKISKVYKRLN
ncbi:MAG: protoporphyrinogen/coproporphyrinogen oxidase [Promethearchaeota archaeon]